MESEVMGKVIVTAKIENLGDIEIRERGLIPAEEVSSVEVHDALVDTGATTLLVPKALIAQLGLRHYRTRPARGLGGSLSMPIYSAVWLTIQGRECAIDVGEIDDRFPVLIGHVPLELLDWVVDPKRQKLIGNPEHGGEHMIDAFAYIEYSDRIDHLDRRLQDQGLETDQRDRSPPESGTHLRLFENPAPAATSSGGISGSQRRATSLRFLPLIVRNTSTKTVAQATRGHSSGDPRPTRAQDRRRQAQGDGQLDRVFQDPGQVAPADIRHRTGAWFRWLTHQIANGLADVAAHHASVPARNPRPVARIRPSLRPRLTSGLVSKTRATTRPTGKNASVNTIPRAITSPEVMQRAVARPDPTRPAQQARARAVVESRGKAVSAVGWNIRAEGTSGQNAAEAQLADSERLDRARK